MAARFPGSNQLNFVPRPRAPPRLIRPPSPLAIERPQPIVPDVSLIMDSAATSFQSNYSEYSVGEVYPTRPISNQRQISPRNPAPARNDSSSITPNINFANYYPTPPENFRNNNSSQMSRSRSLSKEDSGHGTSAAELSRSRTNASMNDDTSVSENLPLDEADSSRKTNHSLDCCEDHESMKADIASVLKTVTLQTDSIQRISTQLQQIVAFQEKFLVHIVKKGSAVSKSVQTDDHMFKQPQSHVVEGNKNCGVASKKESADSAEKTGSLRRRRSVRNSGVVSPQHASNEKNKSPVTTQEVARNSRVTSLSGAAPEDRKTGEDFSVLLKNLQISNVPGPSMYSETSMKSIDCPPFMEDTFQHENSVDIGPSVSVNGSYSDEDEEPGENMIPSATYYNNLLSTVNRILDGGQKTNPNGHAQVENNGISQPPSSAKRQSVCSKSSSSSKASSNKDITASYTSGASTSAGSERNFVDRRNEDFKENIPDGVEEAHSLVNRMLENQRSGSNCSGDNAVESTKKYLQSIGVQFDSPGAAGAPAQPLANKQNYMIQQNVYNSIYIPTVNCVPVISESLNSNSGLIDNLARKYIPSGERNQYEMMAGKRNENAALAETTVYGMTPGNLSFATKEYLKRHGLVGESDPTPCPISKPVQGLSPFQGQPRTTAPTGPDFNRSDKILDMTAIRNQPKLM